MLAHLHQVGAMARGGDDDLHRRKPEQIDEIFQVLGILAHRRGDEGAVLGARLARRNRVGPQRLCHRLASRINGEGWVA